MSACKNRCNFNPGIFKFDICSSLISLPLKFLFIPCKRGNFGTDSRPGYITRFPCHFLLIM